MTKSYRRSIAFWLLAVLPLQFCVGEQPATRPNIVFIMADDMGYRNLGCYGGKSIQTPNIDAMCKEGMRFTDCYSGASVCAPARSTLMTGYHLGHAPVRGNNGGTPLFPEDLTVAEILKKAGYLTGGFGKWGLGNQGSVRVRRRSRALIPSSVTTTRSMPTTSTHRIFSGTARGST
jgi:arylsulfatase A-like enzyme